MTDLFSRTLGLLWRATLLLVTVTLTLPLLSLGAHAAVVVDGSQDQPRPTRMDRLLAQRVAEREQALADLERQAAQWSRAQAARAAALSDLGHLGDPDDARVVMPLATYGMSAHFGAKGPWWKADHTGQDFSAPTGTTLYAMADVTVVQVGDAGAYGLRTIFELADGTQLWYCHQSVTMVEPGETIELGEPVGLVGSTGNSTGPHLHLEVRTPSGIAVDPLVWMELLGLTL